MDSKTYWWWQIGFYPNDFYFRYQYPTKPNGIIYNTSDMTFRRGIGVIKNRNGHLDQKVWYSTLIGVNQA